MPYTYEKGSFTCKNPEYFMAVCQFKTHSYVIVGVKDSETGEQFVLASMGRKGGFFGTTLTNENMPTSEQCIGIQAFTISEYQYADFVNFLYEMKKANKSNATVLAVPSAWTNETHINNDSDEKEVSFSWLNQKNKQQFNELTNIPSKKPAYNPDKIGQGISLGNNCRTAAKYLTQTTMTADSLPNVPSFYRASLPFKANLSQGKISTQLFIYPPPPPSVKDPELKKQWEILKKIYTRMDKIAKSSTDENSISSHEKFDSLKKLYQAQYDKLTGNKHSLKDLMTDITKYVTSESAFIDSQRNTRKSFLQFKTSTRKMFNEILKDYSTPENSTSPKK